MTQGVGSDRTRGGAAPDATARLAPGWPAAWPLLVFAGFAAIGLAVFRHALHGAFISDDIGYIVTNPYTSALGAENVVAILDPWGPAKLYTANYAPVHLLLHALERQVFGGDVVGYHVVNVLVHALNSLLLVSLLLASRVPAAGALLGGTLFVVHPANVEAVAWISQLKTGGALALSLGALLAHRRRPGVAALLFALALLTKVSAAFALPMAAAFTWARRGGPGGGPRHWTWLGVWVLIFGVCSIPQFASFEHLGGVDVPAYSDRWVHLWTIAAIGARYLLMAATSYGVSAFQEPAPVTSPLDPWWLAALPAGALLAWRALAALRRRSEEAAWWVGAAASFVLVSQLRPFLHPIADRYLYFILPGLIGGVMLWAVEARERLAGVTGSGRLSAALGRGAAVGAGALVVLFALHSADRAKLWRSETLLLVDAASNYPEGGTAYYLRARRAAQEGDVEGAVAALRAAADRGVDRFMALPADPGLAPIRNAPAFQDVVREMAGRWIERGRARGHSTQPELRVMAHAHLVREEYAEAVELLERALRAGGPLDSVVQSELAAARAARDAQVRRRREAGEQEEEPDRAQTR